MTPELSLADEHLRMAIVEDMEVMLVGMLASLNPKVIFPLCPSCGRALYSFLCFALNASI